MRVDDGESHSATPWPTHRPGTRGVAETGESHGLESRRSLSRWLQLGTSVRLAGVWLSARLSLCCVCLVLPLRP